MLGIKTHCYATKPQSDLATQRVVEKEDALKLLKMWEISPVHNAEIREDYHPHTRDATQDIPLDQGPHEITGESYLLGGQNQGAAPDLGHVYATAFAEKIAGAAVQTVDETESNRITLAPADGYWDKGDLLKVKSENQDRYVLALNKTGDEPDPKVYTVWPPFDHLLKTDDPVSANVNYRLMNDNYDAITTYTVDEATAVTGVGAAFSRFTFTFARGKTARVEMSGQCREIKRLHKTSLDAALGDDPQNDRTIVLSNSSCESGAVIHLMEGQTKNEYILLGDTEDNVTFENCTRGFGGSVPASFSEGQIVAGYDLEDETNGMPIRGLTGGITIGKADDEKRAVLMPPDAEATVTIDEKQKMIGYFGDGGKVMFKLSPENREVTLAMAGYCDLSMIENIIETVKDTPIRVMIQCGTTDGGSFAIAMPKVLFHPPLIGDSKGDIAKVSLESRAVLFDSDNNIDSVVFAY